MENDYFIWTIKRKKKKNVQAYLNVVIYVVKCSLNVIQI